MNSYILLRNTRKSGPYTFNELRSFGLNNFDLIWIEGKSTLWKNASEIKALKEMANQGQKKPLPGELQKSFNESIPHYYKVYSTGNGITTGSNSYADFSQSEKFYYSSKSAGKNLGSLGTSLFGLIVLLIGIALFAFVLMRMIERFG